MPTSSNDDILKILFKIWIKYRFVCDAEMQA